MVPAQRPYWPGAARPSVASPTQAAPARDVAAGGEPWLAGATQPSSLARLTCTCMVRLVDAGGDTDGQRYREVVQPDQGLRIHPAARWRQGRVRAHLGGRASRIEHPQ